MSEINVLEELKAHGAIVELEGDEHAKTHCPFHGDTTVPNLSVRISGEPLGWAKCFACAESVNFIQLLTQYQINYYRANPEKGKPPSAAQVAAYLAKKYGLEEDESVISPQAIDLYAFQIWDENSGYLRNQLYARGLNDETIRKRRIGRDDVRITIPVPNESNDIVNVQRYAPGAKKRKFTNSKTRGKLRIYPLDQLDYETIVITGGPIKALAGTIAFNPMNVGCLTAVGGEHEWLKEFNPKFEGKTIYIALDADNAGKKAAQSRAAELYPFAKDVFIISLNFDDKDKFKKGGLDDYLVVHKDRIPELLSTGEKYSPPNTKELDNQEEPETLPLSEAFDPQYVGKRIASKVHIVGVCETPYYLPKEFELTCTRDAKPDGICALCPVSKIREGEKFVHTVNPESSTFLHLIDKSENLQSRALASHVGVPKPCNRFHCTPQSYYSVEDIRVSPKLEISDRTTDRTNQPALLIKTVEPNSDYEIVGRMWPHPDTQRATLVASVAEPLSDDMRGWTLDQDLSVFAPDEWTLDSLRDRIDEVYSYMGNEITHIYRRQDMHMVADLTYHTVLFFNFQGRQETGWGNAMILGDSGQGKTEVCKSLQSYYELGFRVECKNATIAGLIGGNTQLGDNKKFFVRWGVIPTHDSKLVILEEVGGAKPEVLQAMTDMRSEGKAQLQKIEAKTTRARTRIIATANTRSGRNINTYTFGTDALYEVWGSPQDIRRFDIAIAVSESTNNPVPSTQPYGKIATQEEYRAAVLFAWTRTEDQVIISKEVETLIKAKAKWMCSMYVEEKVPLVNAGNMHKKIAKLAIALAIRTGSVEGENVIVRDCHVEYIVELLDRLYSDTAMGYRKFSAGVKALHSINDEELVTDVLSRIPHISFLQEMLLQEGFVERQDLADWGGLTDDQVRDLISTLVRCRCLVRKNARAYIKTAGFLKYLQNTTFEGQPDFTKGVEDSF